VTSDAKGAKAQCEAAALKLGVAMGEETDMEKAAAESLSPEQKRHFDILLKLRARTTSSYAGEADNATRILEKKMQLSGMEEMRNLLEQTINASRASRFSAGSWNAGSSCNRVQVSFLGEKRLTDFFLRLVRFSANAHSTFCFTGKRDWAGESHIELGFSGQLPVALDAAFLAITTADLALNYADGVRSHKQEALSGFMEGLASEKAQYCHGDMALKLYNEAEAAARMWFNVKGKGRKRSYKRRGAAFDAGRAAGERQRGKIRKTHAINDA
jgi:hypothetical protein